LRLRQAEAALVGRRLDDEALAASVQAMATEVQLRTSRHRATSEYRRELLAPLLARAVRLAAHRAQTGDIQPEGLGLG
jgi:CO/xanthine dehydrogenase FAD-binding subunit